MAPCLNILKGLSVTSITVDSIPILALPPSSIISTWPSISDNTSSTETGGLLPDRFALGATTGTPAFFINKNAIILSGILRPIFSFLLLNATKVKGPGQNLLATLSASFERLISNCRNESKSAMCTLNGLSCGLFFISYNLSMVSLFKAFAAIP